MNNANIRSFDELMMHRCIELARLGAGNISPNPRVGALIAYEGRIIGEGFHQKYGEGHAEVNAIKSIAEKDLQYLKYASIYVSLEPCFHFGQTPPCVNLILKHQIPRVVIAMQDPTDKVAGQSIKKLKAAGVEVLLGVLEAEAKDLIRRFSTFHLKERPYIILKYAQSADAYLGKAREQVWLTNSISKRLVHRWRAIEGAIIVGTNTAIIDNPRLNTRLYFGKHPLRIVIDRRHRIPSSHHLFTDGLATLYFTENKRVDISNTTEQFMLEDWSTLLDSILSILNEKKVKSLLVEGGASLLQSFIDADLWDEARIFKTDKILGDGISVPSIPPRKVSQVQNIGKDRLEIIRNQP